MKLIKAALLFLCIITGSFSVKAQLTDFEKKVYPNQLLDDQDFKAARALGERSSSEAIAAFEKLLVEYDSLKNPHAHLAILYLLGASYHPYNFQKALELYTKAAKHSSAYPELHSRLLTRKAWAMAQLNHPATLKTAKKAYDYASERSYPPEEQLNALTHYYGALHYANRLGDCHEIMPRYINLLEKSRSPGVKHTALSALGRFYSECGIYHRASHFVERDMELCRKAYGDTSLLTTNAYLTVGIVASQVGDHEKEIRYYRKAAEMLDLLIRPRQYHHYSAYYNLGNAQLSLGIYERAFQNLSESKSIIEGLTAPNDPTRSEVYSSLATFHADMGNRDSVAFYANSVQDIFSGVEHASRLQSFFKCGMALSKVGEKEWSQTLLDKVMHVVDERYTGKHPYKARILLARASEKLQRDSFQESINLTEKALNSLRVDSVASADGRENYSDLITARDAFLMRSKALKLSSSNPTRDQLDKLLSCVESGIEIQEQIRDEQLEAAAVRSGSKMNELNELAIYALKELHVKTGEKKYLELAFEPVQRSKGYLLDRFMEDRDLLVQSGPGKADTIRRLREERYLLTRQLENQTAGRDQIQARLASIDEELNALLGEIRESDPRYYNYIAQREVVSLEELRDFLNESDKTYLEYFVSDTAAYAYVVDQTSIKLLHWSIPSDIKSLTRDLLSEMKGMSAEQYSQKASQIYSSVFRPVREEIKTEKVIVVPHHFLAQLPLEILCTKSVNEKGFNQLDYLIKDYEFSYLYSADMLRKDDMGKNDNRAPYLGLAPGFSGDEDRIAQTLRSGNSKSSLTGARKEVELGAEIFENSAIKTDSNLERLIKREGSRFKILHLATHAEIDETSPLNSRIYLGNNTEGEEDGTLYQYELFNEELNNELTILSACKTGMGPWIEGEGVNSLARGFIYSGSRSLMLSHWDLHDHVSLNLVQGFLTNLKNGKEKGEALREAKLAYLSTADGNSSNPYLWGGLALYGDTSPIESGADWPWWLVALSIFVPGALLVMTTRICKKGKKVA